MQAGGIVSQDPELPAFSGYLDGLDPKWRVVGWARPLAETFERLQVRLVEGDTEYTADTAERFRGDLLSAQIGDGKYGFMLPIPADLFDGSRHALSVRVLGVPDPDILGTLDILLPSHAPPNAEGAGLGMPTGGDLLRSVLSRRTPTPDFNIRTFADELTYVLGDIATTYDHATALGMLYIHVLRRRIDEGGLQSRLTRLSKNPGELGNVVREVLNSDEAQKLYSDGAEYRFPNTDMLRVWTTLRRLN